jgi:hypothetical protein
LNDQAASLPFSLSNNPKNGALPGAAVAKNYEFLT